MRLLLDTTYLLPAIGISIKGLPKDAPIKLIKKGHQISISNITIFELSAKGAKHIAIGNLTAERVSTGIRAIVYDDRITRIPIHDSSVLLTAFKLRRTLSDFIDCLILSSAINRNDVLVTEDEHIQNLRKNREFQELLQTTNPKFKIQTLTDTL
ncbi:MAG: PIN domain-containing protein [Candidatus Bathyarchaeia archaeon]